MSRMGDGGLSSGEEWALLDWLDLTDVESEGGYGWTWEAST